MRGVLWLVARREVNSRLRTRTFVVCTIVSALVLAGFVLMRSSVFERDEPSVIGLNGQAISVADQLADEARLVGRTVRTVVVTDLADGRTRVANGSLDALVSGAPAALTALVNTGLDDELRGVLNGLVRQQVLRGQLAALEDPTGLDVDGVLTSVSEAHVTVRTLSAPATMDPSRLAMALVVVALLYLALLFYGALVAQGVVEEKSSRVVEFLLAAVRPRTLLAGKVLGLGLVGLAQLAIVGVVGLLVGWLASVLPSFVAALAALTWGLVWYSLGFLLYATVFAAVGALVSRQEDVLSVLMPAAAVLVVAFVLGFAVLSRDPTGVTTTVLSLVPLLSPILMPGRLALAAAPFWQVALALALTAATIVLLGRLGDRVYRNSLLRKDSRTTLRQALRERP
ncbi:ABC transporter permease [Actinophytocola oryzae]|uniref:ABC-2 type transport system permease protein n=1 Tax=Actinophytocola oryzae TaxID=502181 RepID=A0A4R7V1R7_9PSEU|nr:ABC transporter permease [Actinophytocola oryzae]TDV41785.1 ABC-2 type transport system permease protein [Actinophytocola oryzae]